LLLRGFARDPVSREGAKPRSLEERKTNHWHKKASFTATYASAHRPCGGAHPHGRGLRGVGEAGGRVLSREGGDGAKTDGRGDGEIMKFRTANQRTISFITSQIRANPN